MSRRPRHLIYCYYCSVTGVHSVCEGWCVPPGEVLLGDNKPIETFGAGDLVVGRGGLQNVKAGLARDYSGELVVVKALGMLPLVLTPEHPILVVHGGAVGKDYLEPEWKQAGEVVAKVRGRNGDFLLLPSIKGTDATEGFDLTGYLSPIHNRILFCKNHSIPTRLPLNEDLAWLMGVYVAEGWSADDKLILSISEGEHRFKEAILQVASRLGYKAYIMKEKNEKAVRIAIGSKGLSHLLAEVCGKGATNKKVPDAIFFHRNFDLLRAFLRGYWQGDGHYRQSKPEGVVNTTSKVLILQLQIAYARLGRFISVRVAKQSGPSQIQGRKVNQHTSYGGQVGTGNTPKRKPEAGFFYLPVRSVERRPYTGPVYDLTTQDGTFLLSNAVVHNCACPCPKFFYTSGALRERRKELGVPEEVPRGESPERPVVPVIEMPAWMKLKTQPTAAIKSPSGSST